MQKKLLFLVTLLFLMTLSQITDHPAKAYRTSASAGAIPILIGEELGANDFRVSQMGPAGDDSYDVLSTPVVAYNSKQDEYLVVWSATNNVDAMVNGEPEIFAQRFDADTMAPIGTLGFRVSDMGPDGNTSYFATDPRVVYNVDADE